MKTMTVNYWLIWSALSFLEIAEAENGSPLNLDPENESNVKAAFRRYVLPEVEKWPADRVECLRRSLAYFIDRPDILDGGILANIPDLTMAQPTNIRRFFEWMWDCLFPEERIHEIDIAGASEHNDIMETN